MIVSGRIVKKKETKKNGHLIHYHSEEGQSNWQKQLAKVLVKQLFLSEYKENYKLSMDISVPQKYPPYLPE